MTAHWHQTSALAGLPGMPAVTRAITLHGPGRGWRSRRRGRALEWLESDLPAPAREAFAAARVARLGSLGLPNERHATMADARLDVLTDLDRCIDAAPGVCLDNVIQTYCKRHAAGETNISPKTRAAIPKLSRRMLTEWRRASRAGGWAGLIPQYAARGRPSRIDADEELAGMLESFILRFHPRDTAPTARDWLVARCGEDRVPDLRTVQRWMGRWRKANASLLMAETNPDGWRSKYLPAFGSADADVVALNQRWELDSTPADVLCTDGRHAIIGAIDLYSRRIRMHVAPVSRASEIARGVLRRCLIDWGSPETVVTDNGKDYVSRRVRGVLQDLGIEHAVMPPYSPERKPFIERSFGTLTRQLFAFLSGYTGSNVPERQAIRARQSFAARRGDDESETYRVDLTAAELQQYIDNWVEHVYEHKPHAGLDGRSPFEAAAGQPVRRITDERALDLLLETPERRTVGKQGIRIDCGEYLAAELGEWVGYRVHVRRDSTDWGAVYVFAGDVVPEYLDAAPGQFICRAAHPRRLDKDRAEVAALAKAHARDALREGRAHARKLKREFNPDVAMDDVLAAGAERSGQVLMFPGRGAAHETPALEEAAAARQGGADQPCTGEWWDAVGHLYDNRFLKEDGA